MKKISFLSVLMALLAVTFTGCKEDTEPRLQIPTNFVLNTPPMADQVYYLTCNEDDGTSANTIVLTCTQPDYGLGCFPTYTVQLAKNAEDFVVYDNDREANAAMISTVGMSFQTARMEIGGVEFNNAVNALYGIADVADLPSEPLPVAVRVHAEVEHAPQSAIDSNVITLGGVMPFFYVPKEPAKLYLIGQPSGWNINNGEMYIEETEIGSKIFHGYLEIPAEQFEFRFYTKLGNWETNSVGSQIDDASIEIEIPDGDEGYRGAVFYDPKKTEADKYGKGSWKIPTWEGGQIEIKVNLNNPEDDEDGMTIVMKKFSGKIPGAKLYLIGAPQGWDINKDTKYIEETEKGSNVFTGDLDINAGEFMFRFYKELGDWDMNSIGAQNADNPVNITLTDGKYTGPVFYEPGVSGAGKGSWNIEGWAGGIVTATVDLNALTVEFVKIEE